MIVFHQYVSRVQIVMVGLVRVLTTAGGGGREEAGRGGGRKGGGRKGGGRKGGGRKGGGRKGGGRKGGGGGRSRRSRRRQEEQEEAGEYIDMTTIDEQTNTDIHYTQQTTNKKTYL
jgi:hypothetical protein